jgi:hypothetical protein
MEAGAGLERWRGGVDKWIEGTDKRLERGDARIKEIDDRQDELDREMTRVTTKIGLAAAIGSVVGGGIVTLILAFATKALGG